MNSRDIIKTIGEQEWLEPVDTALTAVAESTVNAAGQPVKNFLHGTWLGHPLHPAITDVPVGAWSAAAALDVYEALTGDETLAPGADACVKLGLVSAVGAALSGMADWQHTSKNARRVGIVHALLNIAATGFYITSWLQRRNDDREAARVSGFFGFAIVMASAWLGGTLIYDEKVGVDHAQRGAKPKDWTPVLPENELRENEPHKASADGIEIFLVKKNGRVFAIGEKCAHMGGPLSKGKLEGDTIVCPWHGSRFSIRDGAVIDGPATMPQPCFDVRVQNGQIEVRKHQP